MNEGLNTFENKENIDPQIEAETTKLESNLEGLQQDVESLGGEEVLQNQLDNNESLRDSLYHKSQRLAWALKGALVFGPAAALGAFGEVNALAHPDYFASGQLEHVSKGFTAMAVVGLITTAMSVIEFIKHNQALREA
jgi:hypothetical protein